MRNRNYYIPFLTSLLSSVPSALIGPGTIFRKWVHTHIWKWRTASRRWWLTWQFLAKFTYTLPKLSSLPSDAERKFYSTCPGAVLELFSAITTQLKLNRPAFYLLAFALKQVSSCNMCRLQLNLIAGLWTISLNVSPLEHGVTLPV